MHSHMNALRAHTCVCINALTHTHWGSAHMHAHITHHACTGTNACVTCLHMCLQHVHTHTQTQFHERLKLSKSWFKWCRFSWIDQSELIYLLFIHHHDTVHTHTEKCTTHWDTHTHTNNTLRAHANTHACTHKMHYKQTQTHTRARAHTHTHTHTRTHTCAHTRTHAHSRAHKKKF